MRKPKEYTADHLWKQYLKLVGLDVNKMPMIQVRETKRAFYGALGNLIVMMRELPDDDEKAADILSELEREVAGFWSNTMLSQN